MRQSRVLHVQVVHLVRQACRPVIPDGIDGIPVQGDELRRFGRQLLGQGLRVGWIVVSKTHPISSGYCQLTGRDQGGVNADLGVPI